MDGDRSRPPRRDDEAGDRVRWRFRQRLRAGGDGKDDVYGLLGNDWLEGNEEEDAIVGDMGKVVDNQLGGHDGDVADPTLDQFIARTSRSSARRSTAPAS